MTTPIEKQQTARAAIPPARSNATPCALLQPAGMECSKPYGHEPPCSPVQNTEPPAPDSQPESVPAAPSVVEPLHGEAWNGGAPRPRTYGFAKAAEFDLELPGGGLVRMRKLRKMQVIELKVMDIRDGFAPELLKDISGDDPERAALAQQEAMLAIVDPQTTDKVFGPINRVVAAAVICPTVVLDGPSTDEQVNVREIEIDDKMAIFEAAMPDELKSAALGEQLAAIKSVRDQPEAGVRDLRDGEAVLPEAE